MHALKFDHAPLIEYEVAGSTHPLNKNAIRS